MYLTRLPSVSPLDFVNLKPTLSQPAPVQISTTPFDRKLLSRNTIFIGPYTLDIHNFLWCFQFHEVAHLVSDQDNYGDAQHKFIDPVIRLTREKFLITCTTLSIEEPVEHSGPLTIYRLVLSFSRLDDEESNEIPVIFLPPGSIQLEDWDIGSPLLPHKDYASLSPILPPLFELVPDVSGGGTMSTISFFVSDEVHSLYLSVTRFEHGVHLGVHIFENTTVRASLFSVLMAQAFEMRVGIGDHNHFSSLAGTCPENPESVVADHPQRMLDFDLYTVMRNKKLWQLFLDWKQASEQQALQTVLVGMNIPACSGSFLRRHLPWRSPFPKRRVCDADLAIIAPSPRIKDPIAALLLENGHEFTFHLDESINTGSDKYSQTYFGHVNILGKSSGRLCLKLFDERLFITAQWDEEDGLGRTIPFRYRTATFNIAEDMARREEAAYDVLDHLQGSMLPYSYGFHYFRLPDGHECLGFIMEAICAVEFEPTLGEWSEERQRSLVKRLRTVFRALRYAGVYQTDWHWGQFLFVPDDVVVAIDFAFALQYPCLCHTPHPVRYRDDWLKMRNLLAGSGVRGDILDEHWLDRDQNEH